MSLTASNVFASLSEQKLGFTFGNPKRVDEKSLTVILPILRDTSLKRQYITFPETDKALVFDTGAIDKMEVHNQGEDHVFIRSGTLFTGKTQSRALQRSAIVFAGDKVKLEVRCVHATHGINPKAKTEYGGITPLGLDQANYSAGYAPKDQGTTWSNVQKSTSNMCSMMGSLKSETSRDRQFRMSSLSSLHSHGHSSGCSGVWASNAGSSPGSTESHNINWHQAGGDDLSKHFNDFAQHFDEVLSKVKLEEKQSGVALITDSGVQTVEIFDHPDSWKALHEAAVKRMGAELVKEDRESVFEFKPENAHKMVNRVLGMDWARKNIFKHRPSNGEPSVEITGLTASGFVGELVEVNDQVVHLTILKRTD